MSKRPRTANAVMSRLRRPAGRLRDLPIWTKLGLIMVVPTLATIYVGTTGLFTQIQEASDAERARTFAELSRASGELADHLQNERAAQVWFQSTRPSATREQALKLYNAEHPLVDAARRPYAQRKAALNEVPEKTSVLLLRLDRRLLDLPSIRSQVSNGRMRVDDAAKNYQDVINDLLNVRDASAQLAGDTALSDHMRAAAAVARGKESIAQQRAVGHQALGQNGFPVSLRRSFLLTDTGATQAETTLRSVGTDADVQLFEQIVSGADRSAAIDQINYFNSRTDDSIATKTFNAQQWDTAMAGYARLYRIVETRLDDSIVDEASTLRSDVQREVFIQTSVLLGMLLLAILFAWLVARSMARSLRELRQGALSVAQFGLPHAVNRLRDPTLSSSLTPAQLADQIAEPLPVRSRDEFGQVTEAFNAVHLEAVRTAAEQAALRSSVSTMFVNLARRSQILVDRLIGHLDRLERGEEDPDRLAELFQLDHLATRMRRNDENLLVLAGADSTRIQREPAALIDVLRAAQSEVEHYTRIEFGNVERDIEVSAHAVNDMVHLVAELFDNATAFSPPNSHVEVSAHHVGDRTILVVEDRGIGISPEQLRDLNERLANPPTVDVAVSRMMGLVVVARLASRHGVRVVLRPADNERGTVAEVDLPPGVLVPRALAGRLQPGAATAFDSGPRPAAPAPRPTFAAPLALESGSAAARGPASGVGHPTGRPFDPNPPLMSGGMLGAGASRAVPAWSDLTGAPAGNSSGAPNGMNGAGARNGEPSTGPNGFAALRGFDAPNGFDDRAGFGPGTGADDGNGFPGPHGNEPLPPLFGSNDQDLPQRRNGEPYRGDEDSGPYGHGGATIPRQLPANPENQGRSPYSAPVSAPPVRPASAPPYGFTRPVSSPPVSAPPGAAQPASAPPAGSAPGGSYPPAPVSGPPVSAPPSWPPVAGDRDTGSTPALPQSLTAALDMTAEMPRVLRSDPSGADNPGNRENQQFTRGPQPSAQPEAQRPVDHAAAARAAAAAQAAAAQATAAEQRSAAQAAALQRAAVDSESQFADETMELPIFRELESAWFQTGHSGDAGNGVGDTGDSDSTADRDAPVAAAITTQRFSTAEPARSSGVPQQASSPEGAPDRMAELSMSGDGHPGRRPANGGGSAAGGWRTVADEGWQAARAAAELPVEVTTNAGLPKRTPMAQLVPGGVERPGVSVQRRTPEAVRGLLSAYHRGVQRGRTKDHPSLPEETPGRQQSSQAGKEHEA